MLYRKCTLLFKFEPSSFPFAFGFAQQTELRFDTYREDVDRILSQKTAEVLENETFEFERTSEWVEVINQAVLAELPSLSPDFKFCVTTSIVQRSPSSGFQMGSSALWNEQVDGHVHYVFENDSIVCSVVVFALSLT